MDERLATIKEYYTDLEYNKNSREEILMEISTLSKGMQFEVKDVNDFADRFLRTASLIKNNLSLFEFVCNHVDVVTAIINYLTNFGTRLMLDCKFEEEYERNEVILLVMLTILNICREHQVQTFLNDAIIKNSILDGSYYKQMTDKCSNETHEMILLEDADLYAVTSYLWIRRHVLPSYLNTIWVQESIKQEFMQTKSILMPRHDLHYIYEMIKIPIRTFRFKKELLTAKTSDKINIVSIWSEDIVAAKNLATSLNCDVAFINTHMDLCDGIVLLPYTKIFGKTLYKWYKLTVDDCIKSSIHEGSTYNLFYDGTWQQPVRDTYWTHNDHLWANATSDDIKKCIDSAEKGFKIWSAKCISSRMQVLCKFVSILKYNGQLQLANVILKCLKFPYTYENSLLCSQSGGLEVTKIRKPRGVIILKEKDETTLLSLLIQILIAGNSVIVICNEDFCSLAPYCDKFSTSGMSPGIVNLLSSKNIQDLESGLCATKYGNYARRFFSKDDPEETYINLTIPKQIILPLK